MSDVVLHLSNKLYHGLLQNVSCSGTQTASSRGVTGGSSNPIPHTDHDIGPNIVHTASQQAVLEAELLI